MKHEGQRAIDEGSGYEPEALISTRAADDIRERVVRIYMSLSPGGRTPRDDEPGDLDSMAFLEFVMAIEREFGIDVDASDLDEANFANTAATIAYIRRKVGEGRP